MSSQQEAITSQSASFQSFEALNSKDEVLFPKVTMRQKAFEDLKEGFSKWQIWLMLAYQDIKLRYRRSVLGPFWLTISMAITVYSMGFLYSKLFHIELERYYPFLVAGMLSWSLISTVLTEATDGLAAADGFIKQIKMPYSLYIHRIAARNILIFFHNILVIIPVIILFHKYAKINVNTLFLFPGLAILYFNSICYGLIIAMIGARYRDISQMIKSLISVIFFVTPVMWAPEALGERHYYLIDLNPFFAFIEIIRSPLLGHLPTVNNLFVVSFVSLFGLWACLAMFTRFRARIIYWL